MCGLTRGLYESETKVRKCGNYSSRNGPIVDRIESMHVAVAGVLLIVN